MARSRPHVGGDIKSHVVTDAYGIYERHYAEMVGLARLLVGDTATAQDVVHDATIRLHASIKRIQDPDRVVAYYRSIVLNLARNQLRGRRRQRTAETTMRREATHSVHHDVRHNERDAVLSAVSSLPRRQQQCVLLRHYSDLDERSIAATLGISVGSVKKHLHRASVRLATTLKEFS